jgi:O-antigen/teichoic acid export membrane protein
VIYIVPTVVANAMAFVLFPFYARHFSPRQYGILDLLSLAFWLVGWSVALQIDQGAGRYIAGEKDHEVVRSYASTALWFAISCYLTFAVVVQVFAVPISHLLLGPHVSVTLTRIAAIWFVFNGLLLTAQAQLRWQLRAVAWASAGVITAVVTVVVSVVLVFGANLEVEGALLGQLVGSVVALGFVLAVSTGTFRFEFDRDRCRKMLRFSMPLIPASIGIFLNLFADRLVVQHDLSLYQVGLYGVAYRIAMIMSLLLAGFQGAASPLILASKDEESTPGDLARILRIFAALSMSLFIFLSLFATPAIRLLAAPEYQPAATLVPFLILSVMFANMFPFAPGLVIAKRTVTMAQLSVAAGLANVGLALLLVPPLGLKGAGIATAVTSIAWFAAFLYASQRHYPAPHSWGHLLGALFSACVLVAAALAVLPTARSEALTIETLAIRTLLTIFGSAGVCFLALGREDLRLIRTRAAARMRWATAA